MAEARGLRWANNTYAYVTRQNTRRLKAFPPLHLHHEAPENEDVDTLPLAKKCPNFDLKHREATLWTGRKNASPSPKLQTDKNRFRAQRIFGKR